MQIKQTRWFYIWIIFFVLGQAASASALTQETSVAQMQTDTQIESQKLSPEKPKKGLTVFLMVGIIINIVMFSIFIVWAIKEWRKK
jgi:hypothetical protein